MKKFFLFSIFAVLVLPCGTASAADHPASYYPELSRSDIAVCRPEFAALQADAVEYFRGHAASYAPGGKSYNTNPSGYADGNNVRIYTQSANEMEARDPLDLYVEGVGSMGPGGGEGDGYGNLQVMNEFRRSEEGLGYYQRDANASVPPRDASKLEYDLYTQASSVAADKCVARVFLTKYYAMHPKGAPAEFAPATRPTIADGPGPIMEEPWNGVGKPPKSPPSERTAALADFRKTCGNSKGSAMLPHYENVFLERRSLKHGPEQWRKELPETVPGIYQCMLQVLLRHRINGVPGFGAGSTRGATRRSKERPAPHLSDDQKVLNEILRLRTPSSPMSEADAKFAAAQLEYEQKLAAQQKAVAEFEAAQRQVAADKAAAAARASAAQEDFARQQAAYQAEQDRYAREKAEYEAQLTGQPVATQGAGTPPLSTSGPGGSSVPPLRPTAALEAHNPANEASQCLELIIKRDFEARGVSTIMGAVFRNSCPYPIETRWCIGGRCATGYDNIATVPNDDIATVRKESDFGISYDQPAPGTTTETRWAGCRQGFAYRPDFAGTLHYACK